MNNLGINYVNRIVINKLFRKNEGALKKRQKSRDLLDFKDSCEYNVVRCFLCEKARI